MSTIHRCWTGIVPILLAGCEIGFGGHRAEEVISKSFAAKVPPRIVVDTFNGEVEVATTPETEVHARVTKWARGSSEEAARSALDQIEVTTTEESGALHIMARSTAPTMTGGRGANVELEVPAASVLELHTRNGKVEVTGPTGNVKAESSNGSIQVKGAKGELHLATSNGQVNVEGGTGHVQVESSNGSVAIRSGQATVDVVTSNGKIHFAGKPATGDHSLRTTNGNIILELPADSRFHIDASTSNGSVSCEFPIKDAAQSSKTRLRADVGDQPETRLQLQTSNGSIKIRREK